MKLPIKKRYLLLLILVLLIGGYYLGPCPTYPEIDAKIAPLDIPLVEIDDYLAKREAKVSNLKPDNEAQVIWADSIRKTEWAVVYLHGFSASAMEGDPVHQRFAARYGANLFLARLAEHGINDRETFKTVTPKDWVDSAKEAIAIGKLIGEKVIVMSCSTGSTHSAFLAAENPDFVDAQLMYSPNFAIDASGTWLMTNPWGLELSRLLSGGDYRHLGLPESCYPYWTVEYRVEGIVAMQALLDATMQTQYFEKTTQPTFIGYYYKDEDNYDGVVSIPMMKEYMETIKTPTNEKEIMAFPNVDSHVIVSGLQSKDWQSVEQETNAFVERVLGMKPVLKE